VNEILQEVLIHYEGVGVPGTGGVSYGDGSVIPTMVIAVSISLALVLIMALLLRGKRARRILVPMVAAVFGLSGIVATVTHAASMFSYTDTVELSLSAPATGVSATVDLSGLFAAYGGAPKTITVQNVSSANVTVDVTLNDVTKTLAVDVVIPKGVASGDYTAEIVYSYVAAPIYMQDMTASICSALTAWDGSNGEILVLKDKRDERGYNIAKLADGNCWMLNNLRLGSESTGMALTPDTSNISSGWTLPQVVAYSMYKADVPYAYGPVTGDSNNINSTTDYGYMYNWCAATAGGTASGGADTCTAGGVMPSDSTGDICPANWRLPRGGNYDQAGNEFANLVATLAGYPSNTDAGFTGAFDRGSRFAAGIQPTGAFRGNYSGFWSSTFSAQGDGGIWWSGSAYPSYANDAFYMDAGSSGDVNPDSADFRVLGFAVRCLLK
jgi:uncharacterized protein (TIGR02145 family)